MLVVCVGGGCMCVWFLIDWAAAKSLRFNRVSRPPSSGLSLLATLFFSSSVPFPSLLPLERIDRQRPPKRRFYERRFVFFYIDVAFMNGASFFSTLASLLWTALRFFSTLASLLFIRSDKRKAHLQQMGVVRSSLVYTSTTTSTTTDWNIRPSFEKKGFPRKKKFFFLFVPRPFKTQRRFL